MESVLNIAWVLLAGLLFGLWRRAGSRYAAAAKSGHSQLLHSRRCQLVALAMLLLLLFPVISVTDDLVAAHNPAEVDCSVRRDHACPSHHSVFTAVAAILPAPAGFPLVYVSLLAPHSLQAPPLKAFLGIAIQNRPPPVA